MSGPRAYTNKTLKRLFGLSRNKCNYPECEEEMSDHASAKRSNICHIEAAKEGGERYNEKMTDKQRADYDNLILLCPTHHDITNDVNKYDVEALQQMKKVHELEMLRRLDSKKLWTKRPTLLANTIKQICAVEIEDLESLTVTNSYAVQGKLDFNKVVEYRPIIEELKVYQGKLNKIYTEIEVAGNGRKEILLKKIARLYQMKKGQVLQQDLSLKNIQKNADNLISAVERAIHDLIDQSPNNDHTLEYEEVDFAVSIIVVDAFMRCKILEEPK